MKIVSIDAMHFSMQHLTKTHFNFYTGADDFKLRWCKQIINQTTENSETINKEVNNQLKELQEFTNIY